MCAKPRGASPDASLVLFTILHPLVDALSASVLWLGTREWRCFFAYNFCAFALQLPFGLALDRWPGALKRAFAAGVALLAAGGTLAWCGQTSLPILCVCCIGNALFHLSAGKLLLDRAAGGSGPVGVFISTGVFGLLAGGLFGASCPGVALPVLTAGVLVGGVRVLGTVTFSAARRCGVRGLSAADGCLLVGLLALVFWRSKVNLSGGMCDGTVLLRSAAALASAVGAAMGGLLADRAGRWLVAGAGIAGSVLLLGGFGAGMPLVWLAAVFLVQLATGPVLSLVCSAARNASGTAFGLNCLALFASIF